MRQTVTLAVLFLSSMASAQNYLTITQKDGQQFSYAFSDKPVVTYTETELVLSTEAIDIQFPLSGLQKFTFEYSFQIISVGTTITVTTGILSVQSVHKHSTSHRM